MNYQTKVEMVICLENFIKSLRRIRNEKAIERMDNFIHGVRD
jgi:hypothetical protein